MTSGERALREGAALIEGVPRAVFTVAGERRLGYLHDVIAQDVAGLTPGRGACAAVLTANGRVAAEVRVLPCPDEVLLDSEEAAGPGVLTYIARHAGLAGCEVIEVTGRFALAALRGPRTDGALGDAGLPVPGEAEAEFAMDGSVLVVRVGWGAAGVDLLGPREAVRDAAMRLGVERATLAELEAARIEAGRPRFGIDVTEELLVNETPLLEHGVCLTKGCYPGQESVARVHNLGHARRALRGLRSNAPAEDGALVAAAEVRMEGVVVGRVTSAAALPSGGGVAIALLREEIPEGATVRAGGTEAVVAELA